MTLLQCNQPVLVLPHMFSRLSAAPSRVGAVPVADPWIIVDILDGD